MVYSVRMCPSAEHSIIIIVGVVLETLKQIESMMLVRNYKGFLDN